MNKNNPQDIKEKGYKALMPSMLGGLYFWTTDFKLNQRIKNKWDAETKKLLKSNL